MSPTTRSSPARPAAARSCSSACTRSCSPRRRASCRRRCTSSLPAPASPRTPSGSTTSSRTTGGSKAGWNSPSHSRSRSYRSPCPSRSRSATPAASGNAATRSATTPTTLPSSRGSPGCSGASWATGTSRRWRASRRSRFRSPGDPGAVAPRRSPARASRPGSSSPAAARAGPTRSSWTLKPDGAWRSFPSRRRATSSSTSRVIRSSRTADWNTSSATRWTTASTGRPGRSIGRPRRRSSRSSSTPSSQGSRAEEVDRLLRGKVFVDLYSVVRQSLRASVEKYSIKDLEPFFDFARAMPLDEAGVARRVVEFALELRRADEIDAETRAKVEAYNKDDCLSARALRDWLERERAARIAAGARIDRPPPVSGDPTDEQKLEREETRAVREKLLAGVPADVAVRSTEQQARWLLANVLDFHWREDKCNWWEYYRLRELSDEQLQDERDGLAGLEFLETIPATSKRKGTVPIHRYRFPSQDTDLRGGEEVHSPNQGGAEGVKIGTI